MKINSDAELQKYLKNNYSKVHRETSISSVYFMITFEDGHKEPLYFENFDGMYFYDTCKLVYIGHSMVGAPLFEYVKNKYKYNLAQAYKYEQTMMINGKHYSIECNNTKNYTLPDSFDIEPLTERECLEWFVSTDRS